MSEYGEIWALISPIRNELKRRCPEMNTDRLESAKRELRTITLLVNRWEELEDEAKDLPEDS